MKRKHKYLPTPKYFIPEQVQRMSQSYQIKCDYLVTISYFLNNEHSFTASLTSSNYSTTSTCTNQSAEQHLTLTMEDAKFDMSVFDISTQSLLDDETSPADSLISSTSNSDSNNDLRIERDAPSRSSSAYQTANTKTELGYDDDGVDGEVLEQTKDRK